MRHLFWHAAGRRLGLGNAFLKLPGKPVLETGISVVLLNHGNGSQFALEQGSKFPAAAAVELLCGCAVGPQPGYKSKPQTFTPPLVPL